MAEVNLIIKADNSQYIQKVQQAQQATQKLHDTSVAGEKREKGILEEIDATLIRLQKSRQKAFTYDDIAKYNKQIEETKQNLQDYEKAGLKVEETNKKTSEGFVALTGKVIASIAVWKTFKYVMESTEATALSFSSTMNGLKTGLDKMLKTMVRGEWKEFFKMFRGGFYDAVKAGKDFTIEMDRIRNVRRQFALQEAELNKKIEEQRRIFYEDDKTAVKDKLKAADEMLSAMEDKSKLEIKIAEETYKAIADITTGKNKLSEKDLSIIVANFEEIDKIAKQYEEITKKISKQEKFGVGAYYDGFIVTQEGLDKLKEQQKALGPDAARFAELIRGYDMLTEAEKTLLGDAMLAVKEANNQFLIESKRVFKMRENMIDSAAAKETAKAKEQRKGFNDSFEAYSRNLDKATKKEKEQKKGFNDSLEAYSKNLDKYTDGEKKKIKSFNDSFEAYSRNMAKQKIEDDKAKDKKVANLEAIADAVNSASQFTMSLYDNELAKLEWQADTQMRIAEQKYRRDIVAAGNNAKRKEEIEKEYNDKRYAIELDLDKKRREIARKAAIAEKISGLFSVGINTAVAITKALPNVLLAALTAAAGALQAGIIAAKPIPQFAKGGWTGNGTYKDSTGERVAGVVHEKEFVVKRGPAYKFREVLEAINKDDRTMIFNKFNKLSPDLGGTTVNNVVVENDGPNKRLDSVIAEQRKLNSKLSNESIQLIGNTKVIRKGSNLRTIKR